MARIQKRVTAKGATTYVVKYRATNGVDRSRGGFITKKAANAFAAKVENDRAHGIDFDPNAGKVLFRDAAATWLISRPDLKETTRAAYADALAPTPAAGHRAKRHKPLADLRIDTTFGGCPINTITREDIREWIARMQAAGKRPSTIRNAYFLVRQVLGQAVQYNKLLANPADYVKLPTDHNTGHVRAVDDPAMFLTATQVRSLAEATPWPYNVLVHLAAWSGLRAAELAGLQIADVTLPVPSINPNAPTKPGTVRVDRTVAWIGGALKYVPPKTKGSRRTVPLTPATTALLRDYLAVHPRRIDPTAPLFPGMRLNRPRPTGVATPADDTGDAYLGSNAIARRQATALADLTVAEAEAGERLVLDWTTPYRHATFYKAVFRPALLRANRLGANLPATASWHSLRHTYASLCIAAGRPPLEVARFMGHAKVTTTLGVYAHLYADDFADAMAALGAMETAPDHGPNVIALRG
jgi:integrase